MRNSCDVLIVGGGPVGLAAAIASRMRGADVLVVDALKPPIDKACGEGLLPDARRDLAALGVNCESDEGASFRGIRFVSWTDDMPVSATADFENEEGFGMRRTALHARLAARAQEIGVRIRWNTHVALGRSVLLGDEPCSYRYLVGADGQSSRVRTWAGLDDGRLITKRFGFRRHYRIPAASDYVEVHWCALGQVYITPVARDEICVAAVTRQSSTRMRQVIDAVPCLREWLPAHKEISVERGALTTTRRLKRVARGNVALIGDASGSVDAITGEGLAIGFRQASLLGRSLEKGSLDFYAAEHEKTLQMPRRIAQTLLLMDANPWIGRAAMQALSASPGLFCGLLRAHMGEESLSRVLLGNGIEMVKRASSGVSHSSAESASM
ncbi:NAD(P)/FAD-dependent oxidoreductase [Alloacidobacterium sp.]|uniref:NAD(P)/FAD-dependent oxidoreductase n=1 Tax=Alloacidobacterium sp. TaxID=2951999 RepID=UPI002D6C1EA4|nr:NAD(P)/FAD-dependent oxidoreductase [Alloacidobacterium sp.]HYK38094.1 NAD(P)/FAD-dependent oxidoreductase [Alloacidobacterium sp.]